MSKINVQCYRMREDIRHLVTAEKLSAAIYQPAAAGLEKSTGFVNADPEDKFLAVQALGGVLMRVCIETRKPSPKLVKSVTRRKSAEWEKKHNGQQVPATIAAKIEERARAELWANMDGECKYYWVLLFADKAFTFAKGGALEAVNSLIRRTLGTFVISPYWEGHLFEEALGAYIKDADDKAEKHGIEFSEDLTMKHGGMQVKLINVDDLQSDAVRQHLALVQKFESVGTYFTQLDRFATVTPFGGLMFEEDNANLTDDQAEAPNARECADGILNAGCAMKMAETIDQLCRAYDDKSRWVNLP